MKIRGEYRDIITRNEEILVDRGWKSNNISKDLGKLIAAMMRNKDFTSNGITYMAVGSSSNAGSENDFKARVYKVFQWSTVDQNIKPPIYHSQNSDWAWAKPIEDINFLYDQSNRSTDVTNKLQINVTFNKNESDLKDKTLEFKEFALLGIGTYNGKTDEIFFINYVDHPPISITFHSDSEDSTVLTRTVQLTFLDGD